MKTKNIVLLTITFVILLLSCSCSTYATPKPYQYKPSTTYSVPKKTKSPYSAKDLEIKLLDHYSYSGYFKLKYKMVMS